MSRLVRLWVIIISWFLSAVCFALTLVARSYVGDLTQLALVFAIIALTNETADMRTQIRTLQEKGNK